MLAPRHGHESRPLEAAPRGVRHTPLTVEEKIPWSGERLWIGTGAFGRLPVTEELRREARRRGVGLLVKTTPALVERINAGLAAGTNLILHVTC